MKTIKIILAVIFIVFCRVESDKILERAKYRGEKDQTEQVQWTLVSDDTVATVYNAVPAQCNSDVRHTASMYVLNLDDVLSDRIIAMERTMMAEYGIKYGDLVLIEGTGRWDGVWQVQDTMNKRFAGQHKIDILVPENIRHGKWDNVKIYVPANEAALRSAKKALSI